MIRGVPYDAEVEYLESTGTQWIDTGIKPLAGMVFSVDMAVPSTSTSMLNGAISNSSRRFMVGVSRSNKIQYGCGNLYSTTIENDGLRHKLDIDTVDMQCRMDGRSVASISAITAFSTVTIYLFARHIDYGAGVDGFVTGQIFGAQIKVSGSLVRDFIPVCFTNELGVSEGAMYDRVTKKLFRNKGTGMFLWGPDVARPIMGLHFMKPRYTAEDYVQDGLVAIWDGVENAGWGVHDPNASAWVDLISGQSSATFQSTEEVTENAVITTTRELMLIPNIESVANSFNTLTIQRVAQELQQGISNNAACGIRFCEKRFGTCMYFRHVLATLESGYGYGPMGYSFPPKYGSFGKGFYNPTDTYPLQSRTMVIGANGDPIAGYDGDSLLAAWGIALKWGSASAKVDVSIGQSSRGRYKNCCIRIYSRALTADEIAANYAVDKARFNLPGVTA